MAASMSIDPEGTTSEQIRALFRVGEVELQRAFVRACPPCAVREYAVDLIDTSPPDRNVRVLNILAGDYFRSGHTSLAIAIGEAAFALASECVQNESGNAKLLDAAARAVAVVSRGCAGWVVMMR